MRLKGLLELFDDWNGDLVINDNDLRHRWRGKTSDFVYREHRKHWDRKKVVAFGFYDGTMFVRIRVGDERKRAILRWIRKKAGK